MGDKRPRRPRLLEKTAELLDLPAVKKEAL